MECVLVQWTCGSIDEARRIARYLVQERLVAKTEIIPWVESITLLDNQLETTQESKVQMITAKECLQHVFDVISRGGSFEVPEAIVTPLIDGNPEFLSWIKESLRIPVGN